VGCGKQLHANATAVRMTRIRDDEMPHMFVPYHFFPIEMAAVAKTRRASDSVGREIYARNRVAGHPAARARLVADAALWRAFDG
jgi:hypothetical protein